METEKVNKQMPAPDQQPDLYDAYDYTDRPEGEPTGVKTPDYIQKLIDARKPSPQQDQNDSGGRS